MAFQTDQDTSHISSGHPIDTHQTPTRQLPYSHQTPFRHPKDSHQSSIMYGHTLVEARCKFFLPSFSLLSCNRGKQSPLLLQPTEVELGLHIRGGVWKKRSNLCFWLNLVQGPFCPPNLVSVIRTIFFKSTSLKTWEEKNYWISAPAAPHQILPGHNSLIFYGFISCLITLRSF